MLMDIMHHGKIFPSDEMDGQMNPSDVLAKKMFWKSKLEIEDFETTVKLHLNNHSF